MSHVRPIRILVYLREGSLIDVQANVILHPLAEVGELLTTDGISR